MNNERRARIVELRPLEGRRRRLSKFLLLNGAEKKEGKIPSGWISSIRCLVRQCSTLYELSQRRPDWDAFSVNVQPRVRGWTKSECWAMARQTINNNKIGYYSHLLRTMRFAAKYPFSTNGFHVVFPVTFIRPSIIVRPLCVLMEMLLTALFLMSSLLSKHLSVF